MQIGLQRNSLIPANRYLGHDLCERGIIFLVIRPIEDRDRLKGMSSLTPMMTMDLDRQVGQIMLLLPVKFRVIPFLQEFWRMSPECPIVHMEFSTNTCPDWWSSPLAWITFAVFCDVFDLLYCWQIWALSWTIFSHRCIYK